MTLWVRGMLAVMIDVWTTTLRECVSKSAVSRLIVKSLPSEDCERYVGPYKINVSCKAF